MKNTRALRILVIALLSIPLVVLLAPVLSMFLLGLLTLVAPLLVMAVPLALVGLVVFALGATRGDADPAVPSAQASAPTLRAPAITAQ
jgi:hypothetical protein